MEKNDNQPKLIPGNVPWIESIGQAWRSRGYIVASAIGTLKETPLYAAWRQLYAQPVDLIRVPVEKFALDIVLVI